MTRNSSFIAGVQLDAEDPGCVYGLWIGKALSITGQLCIRSFLKHGFSFKLFAYGSIESVPEGAEILDAETILPEKDAFVHKSGSLSPASDWFRYRFLYHNGGIWVDMDMICLRPFTMLRLPWFAREDSSTVATGILAFQAGHVILKEMERFASDPSAVTPWDTAAQANLKAQTASLVPDVVQRRRNAEWGWAGPCEFTKAVEYFGLSDLVAPAWTVYPVHYGVWRHLFDGTVKLDGNELAGTFGVHLWGELIRREPDVLQNIAPNGVFANLLETHGMSCLNASDSALPVVTRKSRILVGICSARQNLERREAIRETWMAQGVENITILFFVGNGSQPVENSKDLLQLDAADDYEHLPEKVMAFFRYSLGVDYDFLFKCDDDTYVDLSRLPQLLFEGYDLIGNEFVQSRGAPSGGAGYFLTRCLVERLASDQLFAQTGAEDLIVGEAALRLGARLIGTRRLCWDSSRYPSPENDVVTSHWCSPQRLRELHEIRHKEPTLVFVVHPHWTDHLRMFPGGAFTRCATNCCGTWSLEDQGLIRLRWAAWPEEVLLPAAADDPGQQKYTCEAPLK
jgi:hypothetical protein